MMHPQPEKVLHIGFGSGGTAWAVSRHPVKEIRIAEISPEVLEASDRYLRAVNHGVLDDPRVRIEINDGRNFVLATPEKFDVILSDSIHPRYAGNGSLYTRDYFELCQKRLNPNGIVSMWLPTYSLTPHNYLMILRAFREVFPNTTVWYVPNSLNAFTIVIGRTEPGPVPLDRMAQRMTPAVLTEMDEIGIRSVYDLASALLLDPQGVQELTANTESHVDDVPAVEYESGRILDRDASWLANFVLLAQHMTPLSRAFGGHVDAMQLSRAEEIRDLRIREHINQLVAALERRLLPAKI
jgi:spermidine synthase